jgi:hypothetical protein
MHTDTEAGAKGGWQIATPLFQREGMACPSPSTLTFSDTAPKGTNLNSRGCNPRNVHANSIPTLKGLNIHPLVADIVRPLQGRDSFHGVIPGFTRCYSSCSPPGLKHGGKVAGNARRELERKSGRKVVTSGNYLALTQAGKKKKQIK